MAIMRLSGLPAQGFPHRLNIKQRREAGFGVGHPSPWMPGENMLHAVERVVGGFDPFIFPSATGLVGPLGVFQFIGENLEPRSQPDLLMLEVLPGRFGADFPSTVIRHQMQAMMGAFHLELGIGIHPGDRTGPPAMRHGADLINPADDGAVGVQFRGVGDIAIIRDFIEHKRLPRRGDGHHDRRAIRPGVCAQDGRPFRVGAEGGARHRGRGAHLRMLLGADQPISPLIVIHPPHKIAKFPEIGDGELLPRQQGAVPVHGGLVEAVGIHRGGNGAFTDPVREVGMIVAVLMEDADPGTVRGGREHRIAFPHPEILGNGREALNAWQLIRFTVDIGVDLFPLEGFGAFPAAGLEAGPVFQFQPEPSVLGPILEGRGGLIESPFRAEGFEQVVKLGGAHIVFIADQIDAGMGHRPKCRRPETRPGGLPGFIRPELGDDPGPSVGAGGLGEPDTGAIGLAGIHGVGGALGDHLVGQVVAIGGGPPRGLMDKRDKVHLPAQERAELAHQAVAQRDRGSRDRHRLIVGSRPARRSG